jgi:uncharacterized protein YgbK (DUF1537 family)
MTDLLNLNCIVKVAQFWEEKKLFKIIVIADDFTGANDTGVQVTKHRYSAVTIMNEKLMTKYKDVVDVLVIDTETRSVPPTSAYQRLREVSQAIKSYENAVVYKKVDSTLRGNIGVEIKAMREILEPELTVFAPAFPKNGRTTEKGIHYVKGVPVDRTEFAKDPKNPVTTSDIKLMLESQLNTRVRHKTWEGIKHDLRKGLQIELRDYNTFSFDALCDEDLRTIARSILNLDRKTLWVGSAGLAEAITGVLKEKSGKRPILVIAGSVSEITRSQIFKAVEDGNIELIKLDVKKALTSPADEIEKVRKQCYEHMDKGKDVIISSATDEESIKLAFETGRKKNLSLPEVSEALAQVLGNIAMSVVGEKKPGGLILTGGDTAIHVVSKLSVDGCRINSELEPGIPELVLDGGPFDGLRIVTKAGAFGNEDSILNAIRFLRGE